MHSFRPYALLASAAAFTLLSYAASAHATAIAFKQRTVEVKADPSQGVLETKFSFTNKGKTAVNIIKVESSCGCTTTELTQRHYEPGQSGEIVTRYTLGNHIGIQRKTFAVHCSDQEDPEILTLVADIPEMIRITPAFVTWSKNEAATPKKFVLETTEGVKIDDIDMKSSNPAMEARMDTAAKGHRYEITVTPAATDHFVFATLIFDCRLNKDLARTFRAYATVKPTAASGDDDSKPAK